jgi:hypothetical protein
MFHFTLFSIQQHVANGVCISRSLFVSESTSLLNIYGDYANSLKQNHHLRPTEVEKLEGHTKYYKLLNDSEL